MSEGFELLSHLQAVAHRKAAEYAGLGLVGIYPARGYDRRGRLKWEDVIVNLSPTLGKNLLLDAGLGPGAYTLVGPYMGLISSVGYTTGVAAGDTMASHGGWTEAGLANAPTYTAPRKTAVFAAASGGVKSLTAVLTFTFTGAGTVKGAFIVYGSGASATIDNTGGIIFSGGVFTGGDKSMSPAETLDVSFSTNLNV